MEIRTAISIVEDINPTFEEFKASLINGGLVRLHRVMSLKQNPVEMIRGGHDTLGCFWSYDLDFLRHGDYDFGYGGSPKSWFYFTIDASEDSVDWSHVEFTYTELNDFEREVRLKPHQSIKLLGISDHFGNELDCSTVLGLPLTTGLNPEE